jgi:hypothetical protein
MDRRAAAWAGMIGPVLFVAVFTLEGWLRPGYNPFSMYVSELSLGPRGWVQIVNFVILGVLLLVFARAAAAAFPEGKASGAGPVLLTIIAVSYLVSGPLVMDPASTARAEMSWHGTLHGIFGALVFSLSPVSVFVFWRRFREDPGWRWFRWWSLAAGIVVAGAVILLTVATKGPGLVAFTAWVGLIQRTAIVSHMIWVFAFAYGLYRRGKPV